MTDQPLDQEPEDLLPEEARLQPGARKESFNTEVLEGAQHNDPLADVRDEVPPADGPARPRNKQYPNIPPMPGALPG